MPKLTATLPLLILLSACLTPQERAERLEQEYGGQCVGLGHAVASEAYLKCLRALRNADMAEDMQREMSVGPFR